MPERRSRNSWDRLSPAILDAATEDLKGESDADRLLGGDTEEQNSPVADTVPEEPVEVPAPQIVPPQVTSPNKVPVSTAVPFPADKRRRHEIDSQEWLARELDYGIRSWQRLASRLVGHVPGRPASLLSKRSPLEKNQIFQCLFAANHLLSGYDYDGEMHLVLMPWRELKHVCDTKTMQQWLDNVGELAYDRNTPYDKPIGIEDSVIKELEGRTLNANEQIYRDPANPKRLLTPKEYLDQRIAEDGDWGVALVQTNEEPGVRTMRRSAPSAYYFPFKHHIAVEGYHVDGMGIFEYIALVLQEDCSKLDQGPNQSFFPAIFEPREPHMSRSAGTQTMGTRRGNNTSPPYAQHVLNESAYSQRGVRYKPRLCVLGTPEAYQRPNILSIAAQAALKSIRPTALPPRSPSGGSTIQW